MENLEKLGFVDNGTKQFFENRVPISAQASRATTIVEHPGLSFGEIGPVPSYIK